MNKHLIANRYRLEGSFSLVYIGYDLQEKRTVAIKEMKSQGLTKSEADEAHELFFREINIMKDLQHDNIPRVYDFFLFENRNYMVMQWVDGEDLLTKFKKNGILTEKQALDYMNKIADALVYLQHNGRNVIYKDLKPGNIIVDGTGNLKIIDFGIARIYDEKKTKDTHILGTPGYAPPEAYRETQTDFSADVYSLAATFYHLTTGKEPFQFKFNFPNPRQFNKELSENFSTLLLDCLKKRDERIKNARELKHRLSLISENEFDEIVRSEGEEKENYSKLYLYLLVVVIFQLLLLYSDSGLFLMIFVLPFLIIHPLYLLLNIIQHRFNGFSLVFSIFLYACMIVLLLVSNTGLAWIYWIELFR